MDGTLRLQSHWFIDLSRREVERRYTRSEALAMIQRGDALPSLPVAEAWFMIGVLWMLPVTLSGKIRAWRQMFFLHLFHEFRLCVYSHDPTMALEYLLATAAILLSLFRLIQPGVGIPIPIAGVLVGCFQIWKIASRNAHDRAEAAVFSLIYWVLNFVIWLISLGRPVPIHGLFITLAIGSWISIFSLIHRGGCNGGSASTS